MNDQYQWWLTALGRNLVWARLRLRESGIAEVFDCDGNTLTYDSLDSARAALLDADFRAFDGMDEDDAAELGFAPSEIAPPQGDDEQTLRARMVQPLGGRA